MLRAFTPVRTELTITAATIAAALGHAILAWQPPDAARAVLAAADRVRLSDRAVVDLDALCERLAAVSESGCAVSDGENAFGLRIVAAPVMGPDGTAQAAISLTTRPEGEELDAFVFSALPPPLRAARGLAPAARLAASAA